MKNNIGRSARWLSTLAACAVLGACASQASDAEGQSSDAISITDCQNAAPWAANKAYATGDLVNYSGTTYQCVQGHTSLDNWIPPAVAALWKAADCSGAPTTGSPDAGTDSGPATSPVTDGGTIAPLGPSGTGNLPAGPLFVGYYQSWSEPWKASGADTALAHLPSYVNVVDLSFMAPDAAYTAGSFSLTGTHLDFSYDGATLRDAVAALHAAHPNTKVLVSVGGATLYNWAGFNPQAIAAFVKDFGLDGVDLDYEPGTPNCTSNGTAVSCPSDAEFVSVVTRMRDALPRPAVLSTAAWSVGAYGEGQWANAKPASASTGIALAVFKDPKASAALDLVNVMSYDASPAYNPLEALAAYHHYFSGKITMGIEVPPEAWGGHVYTIQDIASLGAAVVDSNVGGLMLWSIQKPGPAQAFASAMCLALRLSDCTSPLSP